jgi:hypothetical protein
MSFIAIACYQPGKDQSGRMKKLVKRHAPLLYQEGLITGRPPVLLESANGILIEIFEWVSKSAKIKAHKNPKILELWREMQRIGKNVSLSRIDEVDDIFANLRVLR